MTKLPVSKIELGIPHQAVFELVESYKKFYGLETVVGYATRIDEDHHELCIVLEGNRGVIKACVQCNKYDMEDMHRAREIAAKLHREFMKTIFKQIKELIW